MIPASRTAPPRKRSISASATLLGIAVATAGILMAAPASAGLPSISSPPASVLVRFVSNAPGAFGTLDVGRNGRSLLNSGGHSRRLTLPHRIVRRTERLLARLAPSDLRRDVVVSRDGHAYRLAFRLGIRHDYAIAVLPRSALPTSVSSPRFRPVSPRVLALVRYLRVVVAHRTEPCR